MQTSFFWIAGHAVVVCLLPTPGIALLLVDGIATVVSYFYAKNKSSDKQNNTQWTAKTALFFSTRYILSLGHYFSQNHINAEVLTELTELVKNNTEEASVEPRNGVENDQEKASVKQSNLVELEKILITALQHAPKDAITCLLYTSPSPRDLSTSRMPSSA